MAAPLLTLLFLGLVAVGDDVPKPPPVLFLDVLDFFGLLFFLEALSLTSLVMGGAMKDLGDVMNAVVVVC